MLFQLERFCGKNYILNALAYCAPETQAHTLQRVPFRFDSILKSLIHFDS